MIPDATPTLTDLVEPNCSIKITSSDKSSISFVRPFFSEPKANIPLRSNLASPKGLAPGMISTA